MSDDQRLEEEFEQKWNGGTLLRVALMLKNHPLLTLFFVGGILLTSFLEGYSGYVVKRLIDEGIIVQDWAAIMALSRHYVMVWLLFAVAVFSFIRATGYLGHYVKEDMRRTIFDHLQRLQLAYYDKTPSGWLQARTISDTERVGDLVSWGFLDMLWGIGAVSSSLFFMYRINWQLALVITLLVPLILWCAVQFNQRILQAHRLSRKTNSQITSSYSQNITGVRVIKALRREEANLQRFSQLSETMYEGSFRAAWLSAMFLPVVQVVTAVGVVAIIALSGWQLRLGNMTLGGVQAFVGYVTFMLWPIQQMASVWASMQQAIASAERIFSLLDTAPTIVDQPNAQEPTHLRGDILFNHVKFSYDGVQTVLHDLHLTIKQGETIALVGPTGAGKSTIVNLVARFYEPTEGQITINGYDYKTITQRALQSRMGIVLQTPHLFGGTIMENLRYGRLEATDEEVIRAAKLAGADAFITKLDKGYAAQVGEGGVLLSVGQKQLISIGRAILANPDILIMDEATSSVDTLTESLIQQGMDQLLTGRTNFIIAHRLSTIKNADRILVVEKGRVTEMGTHSELLRLQGHYYHLYTQQFRREQEKALLWEKSELVSADLHPSAL